LKQGWSTAEMLKTLGTDVEQEERRSPPRDSRGRGHPKFGGYTARDRPAASHRVRAMTPNRYDRELGVYTVCDPADRAVMTPRVLPTPPSTPKSMLSQWQERAMTPRVRPTPPTQPRSQLSMWQHGLKPRTFNRTHDC
jgi:hypothetical protein